MTFHVARFAASFAQGIATEHEARAVVTWYTVRSDVFDPYEEGDILAIAGTFVHWWEFGDSELDDPVTGSPRTDYSEETRIIAVEGRAIEPAIGPAYLLDDGVPSAGISADGPGPPQAAVVLSWLTAEDSRRGRGRWYLPAPRSGSYDASGAFTNMLSSTESEPGHRTIAKWGEAFCRLLHDSLGPTHNDRLAVYSRVDGLARLVTSVRAQQVLGTQRRRCIDTIEYESRDVI